MKYPIMISGIYSIRFKECSNNCVYVGRSNNVDKRFYQHTQQLKKGAHHNPGLQHHFNKYGIEGIIFNIEKECSVQELPVLECEIFKEIQSQGCSMLNARGFIGGEVNICRRRSVVVFDQAKGQVDEKQSQFLRSLFDFAKQLGLMEDMEEMCPVDSQT